VTAVPGFDVNAVVVVSKEVIEKSKIYWGSLQDDQNAHILTKLDSC
jgi:hypothetical protein